MAVETPGAVEAYLAQWEPWNRFHRAKKSRCMLVGRRYSRLSSCDYGAQCPFTQLACGELMQPVAISDRPTAMEFRCC